ncbi:MAG: ABC-F family ATP-binding cassette domain-containing protein [Bacteroidales bacterium]|nr:ABC-F family ATP-binding cassette domain-containing protein [Bacteroidales bacterium]MCF8343983.1 ABC-F family ATP-binding cassette domain-containing protein [Bacteroidales bacterium]MCF8351114.1 ABC-F family ATP-binding cassette domain-containing protein [Bacteroidales bacterium]MCF8376965.1 ABC-F family ATP-binding cassette domain-containing protein [Bacteroidales bacterium]MCF8401307.1 ABC-F family ATP-binding cassette domain-containing protein [Bacteroidales bacterium]
MFSFSNISVHFTGEYLFHNISFLINRRDRIGLVGKNGVGKSTLLKIMHGSLKPEQGEIAIPSGASVGYLPQILNPSTDKTVIKEALEAFKGVLKLKDKLGELSVQLQHSDDYESGAYLEIVQRFNDLNEKIQYAGGQNIEAETEKVLGGLGFRRKDFSRNMGEFSHGWQMRVEIAKILLSRPDLILLDEPTNHLDIESIQWLEEFLKNYPGAVVIVSHDRAMLDNITNRTLEISKGQLYDYKASYSDYLKMREERLDQQIAEYNNQQQEIRQIERFIERFRYKNTKAKQVQSRIKMLEKMDKVEIDDIEQSRIHFSFPTARGSGKIVVEGHNVSKNYGSNKVLEKVDFVALRGEKIAFVGKNGEGKSTFSKIITGHLDYEGELKLGHNVQIGYYAQNQGEFLDQNKTVYDTIDDIATGDIRTRIRAILGGFLFDEDDIDKKVSVLSGGEKSRLSLAKLLLTPVNLLVLDEPTNHLDMSSKDVLKNALLQYNGTLIIVSHDRDFLQGLTSKVYEFKNRKIKEHLGDISEFIRSRKLRNLDELNKGGKSAKKSQDQKSGGQLKWEKKKELEKQLRKIQKSVAGSEARIDELESAITGKDELLANPEKNKNMLAFGDTFFKEYNELKKALDLEMEKWERQQSELEKLQQELKRSIP